MRGQSYLGILTGGTLCTPNNCPFVLIFSHPQVCGMKSEPPNSLFYPVLQLSCLQFDSNLSRHDLRGHLKQTTLSGKTVIATTSIGQASNKELTINLCWTFCSCFCAYLSRIAWREVRISSQKMYQEENNAVIEKTLTKI